VADLPAGAVPVPPLLRGGLRHHHQVAHAYSDLVVAARTAIDLARFVRLHPPDLDVIIVGGPAALQARAQGSQPDTDAGQPVADGR
jgi:hypothetical protein